MGAPAGKDSPQRQRPANREFICLGVVMLVTLKDSNFHVKEKKKEKERKNYVIETLTELVLGGAQYHGRERPGRRGLSSARHPVGLP
jgi:hypothetical protein